MRQLGPGGSLYGEARELVTGIVNRVVEALLGEGFGEVVVADAHGEMVNIDPLRLRRGVRLVRGFPRPLSMLTGARGSSLAVLLGYHAGAGVLSTLSHTYTGDIAGVTLNGEPASEYLLNSMLLGEWGVPVGLVAGSSMLRGEVERWTPWAVWLPLKTETGYLSAVSPSLEEIGEALERAVGEAVARLRRGELRPLEPPGTVELCVEMTNPLYTELPALIPGVERRSDTTVCTRAGSMEEAYKTFEAIAFLAWAARQMIRQAR